MRCSHGVAALSLVLLACQPDAPTLRRDGGSGPSSGTDAWTSTGVDAPFGPLADAGPLEPIDAPFASCSSYSALADTVLAPVDIVWIIDNSGSMDEESVLIQMNINRFVTALSTSGITDYHVVVITDPSEHGLVVPAPLGTDPTRFLLVDNDVRSHDALSDLVSTYPRWSSFLRPTSVLHFVHVTDDESDLSASSFRTMMTAQLGGRSFVSHAIASPPGSRHSGDDGCAGMYGEAADNCEECWEIAMATGGQRISICSSDWTSVFDTLVASIGVPMPLPCEFAIPAPPDGMTFDRDLVNVDYTPTGGAAQRLRRVDSLALCSGPGWYYDALDAPTRVILCPETCSAVSADPSGRIELAFGCATVLF